MATEATRRMNLLLPGDLVTELCALVPPRRRGQFVAAALARELRRLRLLEVLESTEPIWRDEDHPELATGADIDNWIAAGRAQMGWDRPLDD